MKVNLELDYRTGLDLVSVIRHAWLKASENMLASSDEYMVTEYAKEMARWEIMYTSTVIALELTSSRYKTCAQYWAEVDARVLASQ